MGSLEALFPGIYNVSVTADWCHYARHVLCSIAPHSPALDHHFVNGLRAPWRGWLDVTSFVLECLSKLQEEDRCYNSLFDTPLSSCALMCTASHHPKIQCACILLPSRLCKGYSDQFCHCHSIVISSVIVIVDTNFGRPQHQGTCATFKCHEGVDTDGKLAPALQIDSIPLVFAALAD